VKYICFLILLFSLVGSNCSNAQKNNAVFLFSCSIIDSETHKPVSYCYIHNESKRKNCVADLSSICQFSASVGDTLVFQAIGYLGRTYIIKNSDTLPIIITMDAFVYEIEKITINIPQNYAALKQGILEYNPNENRLMPELPQYNPYIRPILLDTNIINDNEFRIFHPVSGFYYKYSKIEKSKRKVRDLQEQELRQNSVDEKYSRELVTRITGFQGEELINFLGYCNFSFNYLYTSTPLEIVESIHQKYTEYLKCCYDKNNSPANP
jgi:hypothetical protein